MSRIYFDGTDAEPYENPLARFKSYSYYHVLALCDSTTTADKLSTSNDVDIWLHPDKGDTSANGALGPWSPRPVVSTNKKGETVTDSSGKYCILINGATDAGMVITDVKFQTLASAGASSNDRFTSLAVEGQIGISEPKGISFLDLIARCCGALGRDAAHVTFVLKTFFVGYNEEDDIETICNIAPLAFVVIDVTGSITEAGGQYKMDFVALNNGVSRLPQYDKMLKSVAIKGETLKDVVSSMQTSIETAYEKMYGCVEKQVIAQETDLGYTNRDLSKRLRRVKYKIELADIYKSGEYKFNTIPQTTSKGTCGGKDGNSAGSASTGTDFSLESALHHMMQHCEKVAADAKTGITTEHKLKNGKTLPVDTKINYKIHTNFKSNPEDPDPYVITYRVEPYPSPRALVGAAADPDSTLEKEVLTPNTIVFEYVYTGQNIDILEFDMKINVGLAYLQIATLQNSYKDQSEPFPALATLPDLSRVAGAGNRTATATDSQPPDIPVFFSTNMDLPNNRSNNNFENKAAEVYDMSKHSSVEVLDVNMKITGNLTLLQSTSVMSGATLGPKENNSETTDWGYVPGFAKIHISMPTNNDDIGLFGGEYGTQGYAKPFWFQGYYYIIGIEHSFSDGEFTQQLSMIGMPEPIVKDAKEVKTEKANFSTKVADCYNDAKCPADTATGTGKTAASNKQDVTMNSPGVESAKKQPVAQLPSTQIDEVVRSMPPENVTGWKNMSPDVKKAITTATQGDKIPLSTYVAIAAIESNGKPGAVSSTGAAGIFQFTRGTWNETMPGYRVSSTTPASEDPRRDANLNAQASRIYLNKVSKALGGTTDPTWLYMGHNLGPGAARSVMNAQKAGNANKSMSELYAEHPSWKPQWAEFAKANGYSQDATVTTVRDQIAGKYAKRISSTNVTAQAPAPAAPTPAEQGAAAANTKPTTQQTPPATSGRKTNEMIMSVSQKCNPSNADTPTTEPEDCSKDKQPDKSTGWGIGKSSAFGGPNDYVHKK